MEKLTSDDVFVLLRIISIVSLLSITTPILVALSIASAASVLLTRYSHPLMYIICALTVISALASVYFGFKCTKKLDHALKSEYTLTTQGYAYYLSRRNSFKPAGIAKRVISALLISGVLFIIAVNSGIVLPLKPLPVFIFALPTIITSLYCVVFRYLLKDLKFKCCDSSENIPDTYDRKKEFLSALIYTLLLWIPAIASYVALCIWSGTLVVFAYIPIITAIFYVAQLLICNPFSNFSSLKRKQISVKLFRTVSVLSIVAAVVYTLTADIWLLMGYVISRPPVYNGNADISYDGKTGVYTLSYDTDDEFRILQLTDIHIGGSITTYRSDKKALECCEKLIRHTSPDLVVVTGDLLFPLPLSSFSVNSRAALVQFSLMMESLGVPWVFVYGNHDTETTSTMKAEDINQNLWYFSRSYSPERNGLQSEITPDISGRYNNYIRLADIKSGETKWLLFLLDSNSYISDNSVNSTEYDNIHDDQILWYADTVKANPGVPSLMFFHIPIEEYMVAESLLRANVPNVEYLFGENSERCSCPLKQNELFETALALGSTKAMFCGHDHINNLGVKYNGIDLVYGMSVDYLAYPGISESFAQRGGTLITIIDQEYSIEQIPLNSI